MKEASQRVLQGVLTMGVASFLVAGCNANKVALSLVEGQVLLDDKPLTTGTVITQPTTGQGARGAIQSDGRFTLETRELGIGAVPGIHRVGVVAVESTDLGNPEAPSKSLVPQIYNSPLTSGLTIEVKAGEKNEVTLSLSSRR